MCSGEGPTHTAGPHAAPQAPSAELAPLQHADRGSPLFALREGQWVAAPSTSSVRGRGPGTLLAWLHQGASPQAPWGPMGLMA